MPAAKASRSSAAATLPTSTTRFADCAQQLRASAPRVAPISTPPARVARTRQPAAHCRIQLEPVWLEWPEAGGGGMTQRFTVHPTHPQARLLRQAARGRCATAGWWRFRPMPATCSPATWTTRRRSIVCVRSARLDDKHLLTLMCRDLSELSVYAQVDNRQYRFLREWTPGPYTFVLPATREVPRRLWHPSRKTIGLRVPTVAGRRRPARGAWRAAARDQPDPAGRRPIRCTNPTRSSSGWHGASTRSSMPAARASQPTTVVDLTGAEPVVTRLGCGPVEGRSEGGFRRAD